MGAKFEVELFLTNVLEPCDFLSTLRKNGIKVSIDECTSIDDWQFTNETMIDAENAMIIRNLLEEKKIILLRFLSNGIESGCFFFQLREGGFCLGN